MMTALISEIVNQFSLRSLYLEIAWFATFGYMMNVFVVMSFTRLPFMTLLQSIFRLQFVSLLISYAVAPVLAALSILLSHTLSVQYAMWFASQQVYVWFTVSMMFITSYLLCQIFVTVPCNRFRLGVWLANITAGVLGVFVLKALNLLKLF